MSNWEEPTKISFFTSCKQAARLVSISFERKLSFREFLCMSIHLWMCKTCSFYKRQITVLRQAFVRHEEVLDHTPASSAESLSLDAKRKIKDSISAVKD